MTILLNTNLRRKLLTYTFTHPDENFYVREMAAIINEDPGNLSRELKKMEQEGLFVSTSRAKAKFYLLNKNYPLFQELKSIIFKTEGIEGSLRELVDKYDGIILSFLYGSYAEGKEKGSSDVDLALIGQFPEGEFTRQIRELETKLGREINFTQYARSEFDRKRNEKGSFLNLVLKKKIIVLKGAING